MGLVDVLVAGGSRHGSVAQVDSVTLATCMSRGDHISLFVPPRKVELDDVASLGSTIKVQHYAIAWVRSWPYPILVDWNAPESGWEYLAFDAIERAQSIELRLRGLDMAEHRLRTMPDRMESAVSMSRSARCATPELRALKRETPWLREEVALRRMQVEEQGRKLR